MTTRKNIVRTFVVFVEDRPGVLNRVISLFRRRGYNIESLTVGRTEKPAVSRITLLVRADEDTIRILEANLYKLINVLHVEDMTHAPSMVRELALVKVRAPAERRAEVFQLCEAFRGRILNVAPDAVTMELTGATHKVDGLIEVLNPFGIIEMVRTGAVAMTRGISGHLSSMSLDAEDGRLGAVGGDRDGSTSTSAKVLAA